MIKTVKNFSEKNVTTRKELKLILRQKGYSIHFLLTTVYTSIQVKKYYVIKLSVKLKRQRTIGKLANKNCDRHFPQKWLKIGTNNNVSKPFVKNFIEDTHSKKTTVQNPQNVISNVNAETTNFNE